MTNDPIIRQSKSKAMPGPGKTAARWLGRCSTEVNASIIPSASGTRPSTNRAVADLLPKGARRKSADSRASAPPAPSTMAPV
jgi:hypothetical protein